MVASLTQIKTEGLTASIVFSGLLAGAESDEAISKLPFIGQDYSAAVRRGIPANILVEQLSFLVNEYLERNPGSEDTLGNCVGVYGSSEYPRCLMSTIFAVHYLNKLEHAGDYAEPILYSYTCHAGIKFESTVVSNDYDGNRTERVCLEIEEKVAEPYYSTLQNIVSERPAFPLGEVCGIYEREPIVGDGCDGGLRTMGMYKRDSEELPLITYITVVYNREEVLWRCMDSVFSQDYPNIEYIVVDGASTDGTLDLIKQYGDKIDYYVSQPDTGLYNAMNRGLKLASGRFICFMNSDDNCLPGAAATVARIYRETGADAVSGQRRRRRESGIIDDGESEKRYPIKNCALTYTLMYHQSLYNSRHVFDRVGYFDEKYKIISDAIHGSLIHNHSDFKTVFTEERLCVFAHGGVSGTMDVWIHEWICNVRDFFPYISYKDAEILYYCLKHYHFPGYRYCNYFTLTRLARKYFNHPEFKRCYYETAMLITLYIYHYSQIYDKLHLELDPSWETSDLFKYYPAGNHRELFDSLSKILERHSLAVDAPVSDSEIEELCRLQSDLIRAKHKAMYRWHRKPLRRFVERMKIAAANIIAKSNRLTIIAVKRYTLYTK